MKEVLASYRWRRRLIWLTATVAFVAGVVVVGVRWSNTAPHEAVASSGGPLKVDYSPPKKVRLTLRDKSALGDATKMLGLTRARLDAHLAALGRSAGPPWGKDQKEAAAAALVALKRAKRSDKDFPRKER